MQRQMARLMAAAVTELANWATAESIPIEVWEKKATARILYNSVPTTAARKIASCVRSQARKEKG